MEVLEEVHVNPYLNIQKDMYYSEIGKLKTNIGKPLTRKEFYQVFTPVVLMLKDSHTNTHFPQEIFDKYIKKGGKLFPDEFNKKIKACFAQIKNDSIKGLIIDVRNNQGGSEVNGNELLQYITDKPF